MALAVCLYWKFYLICFFYSNFSALELSSGSLRHCHCWSDDGRSRQSDKTTDIRQNQKKERNLFCQPEPTIVATYLAMTTVDNKGWPHDAPFVTLTICPPHDRQGISSHLFFFFLILPVVLFHLLSCCFAFVVATDRQCRSVMAS